MKIDIIGSINYGLSKQIYDSLNNSTGDVEFIIGSEGGDVFEGIQIYNLVMMAKKERNLKCIVIGKCMSAATVIVSAFDTVIAARNATFMIHPASAANYGNAETMIRTAEALETISETLVGVYKNTMKIDEKEIRALMTSEKFFTAEEALEFGLVDILVEDVEIEENEIESKETEMADNSELLAAIAALGTNLESRISAVETSLRTEVDAIKASAEANRKTKEEAEAEAAVNEIKALSESGIIQPALRDTIINSGMNAGAMQAIAAQYKSNPPSNLHIENRVPDYIPPKSNLRNFAKAPDGNRGVEIDAKSRQVADLFGEGGLKGRAAVMNAVMSGQIKYTLSK